MIPTTQTFIHQLIEQAVHVGDTVVDGTTANGINTRFLATRVGSTGRVLSYTTTKDNANATAASLFMSGLSERVTLLGKTIDRQFVAELGLQDQASIAVFDYSSDSENNHDRPDDYLDQIDRVIPRLTHGGLLIIKFNVVPKTWLDYCQSLLTADFKQATYKTDKTQIYLIERV
ncbi:SAM-dependent methyltransferase [Leuconostoc rapi]|uniref:SAM-dependent methyltransferase n=1 Tax=Leuconostoc rapi TaxID=1406906 RepID=UPI0019561CF8|nr:SAM-dependent methyltransferase [Leuconostoc rapi]MBM7434872.1 putative methyltransferase [Leuconostoc rapi]